jgi:hypothetical protein
MQTTAGQWMGVAAEIGEHGLWPAEGRLGVDNPFLLGQGRQPGGKGIGLCERLEVTEEGQLPGLMQCRQSFEEQAPEQPGQHPDGQEEAGAAGNPSGTV